jgi:hypothetical protein
VAGLLKFLASRQELGEKLIILLKKKNALLGKAFKVMVDLSI